MNIRNMTVIALKILAVYVVIQSLQHLPMFISTSQMFSTLNDPMMHTTINFPIVLIGMLPFLIIVGAGVMLWIYAEKLTVFIMKKQNINEDSDKQDNKINAYHLQTAAFSVVGLIVLVHAIPQLFNLIPGLLLLQEQYASIVSTNMSNSLFHSIGVILQIFIGVYLLFSAKGLSNMLQKVRG
ncbi:hypothetical protein LGQ02_15125 [Bacillus shivajii]|uniref:hypothetical protein n=1 Tax=Bacillus shivajii TaxID=1983719 RepID=UPI001CFC0AD8|nr:hypothetical protein [Bacillus shivajii]UCZ52167.1 hypothetical protein LGQ02_15125 [Bacillus shivajii]